MVGRTGSLNAVVDSSETGRSCLSRMGWCAILCRGCDIHLGKAGIHSLLISGQKEKGIFYSAWLGKHDYTVYSLLAPSLQEGYLQTS